MATAPPPGQLFNFFIVFAGETCGAHEEFIRKLERKGQIQKQSVEESDYILAFCPSPGADVQEAMGKIPSGKRVILVVMHHRHDVEAPLDDSSRHVSREDVILTVDTLFWEGEFLTCSHNDDAFSKVLETVGHYSFQHRWKTTLKSIWNSIPAWPGETSQPASENVSSSGQLFNFFIVLAGETCGAHEEFTRRLEHKGQIQKQSVKESDYILAFCPSPSRTGADVQQAMGKIPSGKRVILVVMHHRHDVEAPLDDSSRHVSRDDVILTVDTVFWEGEFLTCSHNKKAFSKVLETVGHYSV